MPKFNFWNREYNYGGFPLPEQIKVGDENIFAGSADIVVNGVKDGVSERYSWITETPFLQRHEKYGDVWSFAAICKNAKLIFNATIRAEEDGFVWCELTLLTEINSTPDFESVSLEIPLKKEICELINFCSLDRSVKIKNSDYMPKDGAVLPFLPSFWVGREDAGFGFYMESTQNIILSDDDVMLELIPRGDAVILKVRLLDAVPRKWNETDNWGRASLPVVFKFGIQATPIKKFVKPAGFERAVHGDIGNLTDDVIDELPSLGAKYVIFHENWSLIQNYGLPSADGIFERKVERCHKNGLKVLTYFGYEYSSLAPDFADTWDKYLVRNPDGSIRGGWQRNPSQRDFIVCYHSDYAAVMRERVRNALDKYHIDGIYTDGTYIVFPCANESHGCGWRDDKGGLYFTYPIMAWRDHCRKLSELVHSYGGIVDAHNGGLCFAPVLGFADSYWDGEAIQEAFQQDIGGYFNFGTLRAQFTGVNFGIPSQFIVYTTPELSYENISGLLLVCGVMGRPYGIENARRAAKYWRELDEFGIDDAEFIPAWDKRGIISTDTNGVYASCWVKNGGRDTLAAVFNTSEEDKETRVSFMDKTAVIKAPARVAVFVHFN